MLTATLTPQHPFDLTQTLAPLVRGPNDPTAFFDERGDFWRATRTPLGPATMRVQARARLGRIDVTAWGEGAAWIAEHARDLVGDSDGAGAASFAPSGKLAELHRRFGGGRFVKTRAVFEATLPAVLEQLVSSLEAYHSYRCIAQAFSEAAPGPVALQLPPSPDAIRRRSSFDLRAMKVGARQARAIAFAAARAERLEETLTMSAADADKRLCAFPGIGPWTSACVRQIALGDPDAVPLGDFNLPHAVVYAFTGSPRGDDRQMLELLAPYAGHRGRVVRLIMSAGIAAPRFGHRRRLR